MRVRGRDGEEVFPTVGVAMVAAGPASRAWAPLSPGIKQGCGSHHT